MRDVMIPAVDLAQYREPINGLELCGYESPHSHRPLLHFIHGTGFCGLTYWPFLSCFREAFDLFLHDVQGHGESQTNGRFVGWNRSASNALAIMEAREPHFSNRPVIGIAHSFGAALTLLMAAQVPHRFQGLVLLEPVLFPVKQLRMMELLKVLRLLGYNPMARQARRRTKSWSNEAQAREYLHQRGIFRNWSDASFSAYIQHALEHHEDGHLSLKCPARFEAELFSSFPARLWRHVKALEVPTVLIRGNRGYGSLAKTAAQAAEINANIRVEVVHGGHCFMQEDPTAAAGAITRILKALLSDVKST